MPFPPAQCLLVVPVTLLALAPRVPAQTRVRHRALCTSVRDALHRAALAPASGLPRPAGQSRAAILKRILPRVSRRRTAYDRVHARTLAYRVDSPRRPSPNPVFVHFSR